MRIVEDRSGSVMVEGIAASVPAIVGSVVMSESGLLGEVTQVRDNELWAGPVRVCAQGEEFWQLPQIGDEIGGRTDDLVVGVWAHPQAGPGRPWVDVAVVGERGLAVRTMRAEDVWWPQPWGGARSVERVTLCRALGMVLSMQREAAQEGMSASWALLREVWSVAGVSGEQEAAQVLAKHGMSMPSRPVPVTLDVEVLAEVVKDAPSWDCAQPLVSYEDLLAALGRGAELHVAEWDTIDPETDA